MAFAGALETPLEYFLASDLPWAITVYTDTAKTACRDITGWSTVFMVKRRKTDADVDALLTLSGSVSGVFNSDPTLNTQVVTFSVADTQTDTEIVPGTYYWEAKRTDAGFARPFAFGSFTTRRGVRKATS